MHSQHLVDSNHTNGAEISRGHLFLQLPSTCYTDNENCIIYSQTTLQSTAFTAIVCNAAACEVSTFKTKALDNEQMVGVLEAKQK